MSYYEIIKSINLIFLDCWRCLSEALVFIGKNSDSIRNIAQTCQAFITSLGIIIAGIWFIRKRQQFPRANLTHKIIHKELNKNTLLIHITVTVENISNVPIELDYCKMRIQWVSPLDEDVEQAIKQAEYKKLEKIPFRTIESKEWDFKDPNREDNDRIVEPGEKHNIECDFILKREKLIKNVTSIMIYCYIKNTKYNRTLGWRFVDIHDLESSMTKKKSKQQQTEEINVAAKPEKDPKIQIESKKKSSNPENKKQDDQEDR